MSQQYSYLAGMFRILSWEQHLDKEAIVSELQNSIDNWYQDVTLLKEEIQQALLAPSFDWVEIALKNDFIYERIKPQYTNKDIIYRMYSYVWNYLYPEKALNTEELEMLSRMAVEILQNEHNDDGWVLQSEIGKILEQRYPKFNAINTFILDDLVERRIILRRRNEGMDPNGFMRHNYSLKIARCCQKRRFS